MNFIFIITTPNDDYIKDVDLHTKELNNTCQSIAEAFKYVKDDFKYKIIISGNDTRYIQDNNIIYIPNKTDKNTANFSLEKITSKQSALKYAKEHIKNGYFICLEIGDLISNTFNQDIVEILKNNNDVKCILMSSGLIKTNDKILLVDGVKRKFYKNFTSNAIISLEIDYEILKQTVNISTLLDTIIQYNINCIFTINPLVCSLIDLRVSYIGLEKDEKFTKDLVYYFSSNERAKSYYRLLFRK